MNTIRLTLLHDFRALRWWLALWIELLAINYWVQLGYLGIDIGSTFPVPALFSVTVFMTSLFIMGRMVFHHRYSCRLEDAAHDRLAGGRREINLHWSIFSFDTQPVYPVGEKQRVSLAY